MPAEPGPPLSPSLLWGHDIPDGGGAVRDTPPHTAGQPLALTRVPLAHPSCWLPSVSFKAAPGPCFH